MDGRSATASGAALRKVVLIDQRESCENDKEGLQSAHRSPNQPDDFAIGATKDCDTLRNGGASLFDCAPHLAGFHAAQELLNAIGRDGIMLSPVHLSCLSFPS